MPRRLNMAARFWAKVDKQGSGGCWLWTGALQPDGYARFRTTKPNSVAAHRMAYELLVGPVPGGLVLDHLCRVRHCVNPAHLEAVTQQENILRGTSAQAENATKATCPAGHAYSGVNSNGSRICRPCQTEAQRRYREKQARHAA